MKIGNYTIPDIRLIPKLTQWVSEIYKNYQLDDWDNEDAAAKLCGHKSANSGAWYSKLADMRLYGLVEPRSLKLTSLAEKLHRTEKEKQEAINGAVFNVPLWKELYSRFGVALPESNFWVQLQRITGLETLEAQKHAESVRNAYLEDIRHVKAENKGGSQDMDRNIDTSVATINLQAGPFSQTIPFTEEGLELAKGFLDLLKRQIKSEKESLKTEV